MHRAPRDAQRLSGTNLDGSAVNRPGKDALDTLEDFLVSLALDAEDRNFNAEDFLLSDFHRQIRSSHVTHVDGCALLLDGREPAPLARKWPPIKQARANCFERRSKRRLDVVDTR